MKKTWIARLSALALALVLLAGLCPAAFADGEAAPRYVHDTTQEKVYAVRVGTGSEEDCAALLKTMQEAGFDAYLYESSGRLNVLCGKFRDPEEAKPYREQIREAVEGAETFLSRAWLPAEAIDAFEESLKPAAEENASPHTARRTSSWEVTEGTQVYTISLCLCRELGAAENIVATLESKGFDAFIYESTNGYQVLSGKFHTICDALIYRDCIWSNTDYSDTYITEMTLNADEIEAFLERYESEGLPGRVRDNLEEPTGPFYRETKGDTLAYVVQFSAGTSFRGAERNRDAMTDAGYPSFVYECSRIYECMTGAFYNREDADAYLQQFQDDTGRYNAYVTRAWLPAGIVK